MTQHLEHSEQCAVIDWANHLAPRWPCLKWLHAVPNGASGNPRRGAWFKAEGVRAGVADLFLPFPSHGYHGLYLEMKRPGALNEIKSNQKEFLAYCESVGYLAQAFDNASDAIAALMDYLQ